MRSVYPFFCQCSVYYAGMKEITEVISCVLVRVTTLYTFMADKSLYNVQIQQLPSCMFGAVIEVFVLLLFIYC